MEILKRKGVKVVDSFEVNSLLTMPAEGKITFKVLEALIEGKPIVTVDFWDQNANFDDWKLFIPKIPGLEHHDLNRKNMFHGIIFYFTVKQQMMDWTPICDQLDGTSVFVTSSTNCKRHAVGSAYFLEPRTEVASQGSVNLAEEHSEILHTYNIKRISKRSLSMAIIRGTFDEFNVETTSQPTDIADSKMAVIINRFASLGIKLEENQPREIFLEAVTNNMHHYINHKWISIVSLSEVLSNLEGLISTSDDNYDKMWASLSTQLSKTPIRCLAEICLRTVEMLINRMDKNSAELYELFLGSLKIAKTAEKLGEYFMGPQQIAELFRKPNLCEEKMLTIQRFLVLSLQETHYSLVEEFSQSLLLRREKK